MIPLGTSSLLAPPLNWSRSARAFVSEVERRPRALEAWSEAAMQRRARNRARGDVGGSGGL